MTYSGLASDRFLGLEGVRALAILAVMVHHLAFLGPEHPAGLLPGGFLGVDVFLVLSGYLITRSITEELRSTNSFSFSRFAARRMWRLLPALLGMMLIHGVVLLFLGDPKSEELLQLLLNVTFVSNWQLSVGHHAPLDLVHLWSLSVEVQLYALLAFGGVLIARASPGRKARGLSAGFFLTIAACVILAVGLLRVAMWRAGFNTEAMFQRTDLRLDALAAGVGIAVITARYPRISSRWSFGLGIAGLAIISCLMWTAEDRSYGINHGGYTLAAVASAALIYAAGDRNTLARLLAMTPLRALGAISYSLYLWHLPVFIWVRRMDLDISFFARLVMAWSASIAIASVSYVLLERPFLRARHAARPEALAKA